MKKIKLLAPLLTTITVSSSILPIVGCNITEPTHAYISDVANKKVEAQDVEVSSETKYNTARFYITLDESTYELEDLTIKMIAQDTSNFVLEPFISGNTLVLDIRTKTYVNEELNYKFDLEISHADWTNKIEGCVIVFAKGAVERSEWSQAFDNLLMSSYNQNETTNYTVNLSITDLTTNDTVNQICKADGYKEYGKIDDVEYYCELDNDNIIRKYRVNPDNKADLILEDTKSSAYYYNFINDINAATDQNDVLPVIKYGFEYFSYNKSSKIYFAEEIGAAGFTNVTIKLDEQKRITYIQYQFDYQGDSKVYTNEVTYNDASFTRPEATTAIDVPSTSAHNFTVTNTTPGFGYSYTYKFKLGDSTFDFQTNKNIDLSVKWNVTSGTFSENDKISIKFFIDSPLWYTDVRADKSMNYISTTSGSFGGANIF